VKGVDRKTSLLQFVVASLLKKRGDRPGGIGTLSAQLSAVKPAANLQARPAQLTFGARLTLLTLLGVPRLYTACLFMHLSIPCSCRLHQS